MIDAGNAVAVLLAAQAHRATQLAAICEARIIRDVSVAEAHEQWSELSAELRTRLKAAGERHAAEAEHRKRLRTVMGKMPCLFAPDPAPT